jgi:hypothetical protein
MMAENPRTETARDHDDRELIEGMIAEGSATGGSSGGQLQRDVGSHNDLTQAVDDPEAHEAVSKQTAIDHDQARPADRGPNR